MYGERHYKKFTVSHSTEISVNYGDLLDCGVWSGQEAGINIVYLTLSKNGEYAALKLYTDTNCTPYHTHTNTHTHTHIHTHTHTHIHTPSHTYTQKTSVN